MSQSASLLRCTASVAKCSPVRFQVRSLAAGDAAVLRKHGTRRHSVVPAQATSVGGELSCSAGVLIVMMRVRHIHYSTSTYPPSYWLEAREQTDFKLALFVKCQHGAAPPYLAEELGQPADFEARRRLRSASSPSLIVCRTRSAVVNYRRPSLSGDRSSCLEQPAAATSLSVFHSTGAVLNRIFIFVVSNPYIYGRC